MANRAAELEGKRLRRNADRARARRLRIKIRDQGVGAVAPDDLAWLETYRDARPGRPRNGEAEAPEAPEASPAGPPVRIETTSPAPAAAERVLADAPPVDLDETPAELVDESEAPGGDGDAAAAEAPEPTEAERARAKALGVALGQWIRYCDRRCTELGAPIATPADLGVDKETMLDTVCAFVAGAGERVALKYSVAVPYEDELVVVAALTVPWGLVRRAQKASLNAAPPAPEEAASTRAPEPPPAPPPRETQVDDDPRPRPPGPFVSHDA